VLGHLPAAQPGHLDVGQEQVDGAGVLLPEADGLRPVGRLQDDVALAPEDHADEAPQGRLVVHQQDGLAPVRPGRAGAVPRVLRNDHGAVPSAVTLS
jgi:hypothetical protein